MEHLYDRFPQNKEEADEAEQALTEELEKLSLEQEDVLFNVYGVAENSVEDDAAVVAAKLQEMHRELLALIANKKAAAYEQAWRMDRTFVEGENFRKLFLRAEGFDAKKAAQRLVVHFEVKQDLFGHPPYNKNNILVRDVTWDDLSGEDQRIVLSGIIQVGSQRDIPGRTTVYVPSALMQSYWKPESRARATWYFLMSLLRTDVNVQTKGVVFVTIHVQGKVSSIPTMRYLVRVLSCVPFSIAAIHHCYDNRALHLAIVGYRWMMFASSPRTSLGLRFHYVSTLEEIAAELDSFGIRFEGSPWGELLLKRKETKNTNTPVNLLQGLSRTWHLQWLKAIQKSEHRQGGIDEKKREAENGATKHSPAETKDSSELLPQPAAVPPPATALRPPTVANSTRGAFSAILIPSPCDVLFGRDKFAWEHPGTLHCHELVRAHREVYDKASRRVKTKVTGQIIAMVQRSNGRFLRWEEFPYSSGGSWVVVDDKEARNKVSHMFRRARELEKRVQQQKGALATAPVVDTRSKNGSGVDEKNYSSYH